MTNKFFSPNGIITEDRSGEWLYELTHSTIAPKAPPAPRSRRRFRVRPLSARRDGRRRRRCSSATSRSSSSSRSPPSPRTGSASRSRPTATGLAFWDWSVHTDFAGFWSDVTQPAALPGDLAVAVALARRWRPINAVAGIAIAWVLVRDEFLGKRVVEGVIDLPFALPTIVAGVVFLFLYRHVEPDPRRPLRDVDGPAHRPALRDAPVLGPRRPARPRVARRPRRGGGALPRRRRLPDVPHGRAALAAAGGARAASASPSRAPSASSARSPSSLAASPAPRPRRCYIYNLMQGPPDDAGRRRPRSPSRCSSSASSCCVLALVAPLSAAVPRERLTA